MSHNDDIAKVGHLIGNSVSHLPMGQTQDAIAAWGRIVAALPKDGAAEAAPAPAPPVKGKAARAS